MNRFPTASAPLPGSGAQTRPQPLPRFPTLREGSGGSGWEGVGRKGLRLDHCREVVRHPPLSKSTRPHPNAARDPKYTVVPQRERLDRGEPIRYEE